MKIIVMSDSHGDRLTVEQVAKKEGDAHFHCGDSEITSADSILNSMYKVRGNCDMGEAFPDEVETTIDGKKVWMIHGHRHSVKGPSFISLNLFYEAREKGVDIVLFGHSHVYGAEMQEGILFVNPGSTLLPRGGNPATYAVVELGENVTVTFKGLDDEVIQTEVFTND